MAKRELKKANGDVYLEASRSHDNSFIFVNWIGIQSLESIMMGANVVLDMLRERPCPKILNSNKELIGPWNDGALFLGKKWASKAKQAGVTKFAQILGPGIYGRKSFSFFLEYAIDHLDIKSFETESEALAWLNER
ncbi:hypothetical protein [Nibribacter koreensis]|uniref:SpoIIAA-like n=1 Tax=Nibribacter koreensis TaxID=1084519 RepID=A0ABP8F5X6_9BACT